MQISKTDRLVINFNFHGLYHLVMKRKEFVRLFFHGFFLFNEKKVLTNIISAFRYI